MLVFGLGVGNLYKARIRWKRIIEFWTLLTDEKFTHIGHFLDAKEQVYYVCCPKYANEVKVLNSVVESLYTYTKPSRRMDYGVVMGFGVQSPKIGLKANLSISEIVLLDLFGVFCIAKL